MGIADRKKREREWRRKEILDAAEPLFFSQGYDKVSMDTIAQAAELNKATIYLYFRNKEDLLAGVALRGVRILHQKYAECAETQVPGLTKLSLMARVYYRFTKEHSDYCQLIQFYSHREISDENPCAAEIKKTLQTCRTIMRDMIQEGIDDGTIRNDISPFLISMYLMVTFQGILSIRDSWKKVIEEEGFSHEEFIREFARFITPAVDAQASKEKPSFFELKDLESYGIFGNEPIEIKFPKRKRSIETIKKK